ASSGTALTKEQIALIKRFTQNLYLCFDMDMAGQNATKRGVDLAIEEGLDVKIITLDNGKDPDELVKEDKEAWLVAIKEAKPLLDHYFAKTFADFDASKLEDKKKAAAALMPLLAKIQNEVEREHYLQKLAGKISTDERVLSEALKNKYLSKKTQPVRLNQRFGQSQKDDQSSSRPSKDIIEEVAERIIGILIKFPQAVKEFESQENLIENLSSEKAQLVKKVISLYNTKANNKWFDSEKLIKHLDQEDSSLALLSKQLLLKLEGDYPSIVAGSFNDEAKIELENGFRRLKKYQLQKRLAEIASSMKEAEEQGHQDKISNLSQEFGELTTKLMQF
ncbi:toprim domain-containing protein, partial [Patescibacteria group bacterium]|nr:toprim domain-containing protein [Patescibacteria group bacterium]